MIRVYAKEDGDFANLGPGCHGCHWPIPRCKCEDGPFYRKEDWKEYKLRKDIIKVFS